nr:hypothetical protein [Tanacetum cinerariifolium]
MRVEVEDRRLSCRRGRKGTTLLWKRDDCSTSSSFMVDSCHILEVLKVCQRGVSSFNIVHILVMKRFEDNTLEGYNLLLWGDLKIDDFVPMDIKKEEKKLVEPDSKGKKGKRIKRVANSALKQKSSKKQKMIQEQEFAKSDEEESADYKHEKEELRMWLTVVLDKEETIDPEILSTKYLIVDWESQILGNVDTEDVHVYKITRANGNTNYHKSLSIILRKFDRQDLVDLHILVMKRFEDNTLE